MNGIRWAALALFGLLMALPLVANGVGAAGADRAAPDLDSAHVTLLVLPEPLVPVWDSAAAEKGGHSDGRLAQYDAVELTKQDFEDATFPPTGWRAIDIQARDEHLAQPRYVWNRQTCEVDPLVGGSAAAWALGGGTEGQKLPCVSPYPATAKVNSWLTYQGLDLSAYDGGMQVRIRVRLDKPNPTAFSVCGADADSGQMWCYSNIQAGQVPWVNLETQDGPMTFDTLAGVKSAVLVIQYVDLTPTGSNFGAVVDNIIIEGLKSSLPTLTPTPPATNTPRWTPTPSPTATPVLQHIVLPVVINNTDKFPMPTPMPMIGAEVVFGTGVDASTGAVTGQSVSFPSGVLNLCAKERWFGQIVGTSMRWQWYRNGSPADVPGLNGSKDLDKPEGFVYQCTQGPPNGTYEVRVYMAGAADPTTSGSARVGQ